MTERLFNYQQEPRPFGMKTRRLNAVTRTLLAIFAMMLIPQSTWADEVNYYRYDGAKFVEDKVDTYTTLFGKTNNSDEYPLTAGVTYVVPSLSSGDPVEYRGRLVISSGTVNIILCDGATLKAQRGIEVSAAATLNIFGQEKGTGQLIAEGNYYNVFESANAIRYYAYAPIGGSHTNYNSTNAGTLSKCGTIVIHGGIITANSSGTGSAANAAGIGGCDSEGPLALTVYGGKVTATGGQYSAGIGGGGVGQAGGTVSIYGGEVIATGGEGDASNVVAMGIGRGSVSNTAISGPSEGSLTINAGVYYYAGTTANPTNQMADTGTRFQYMKTIRTYDLWLGKNMFAAGTQVTAANASDLLGSLAGATGSMSFSPNTNTLVLNNAAFGQNIISGLDDLTIEFSGANSIILDGDTGTVIRSTNANATLTFKHTGTADSLYLRHRNDNDGNTFSILSGFKSIDYSTDGLYLKSYSPTKYVSYNTGASATLMSLLSAASRVSRRFNPDNEEITYPCINSATITTTQTYPVWVKGIQVTADNFDNILDDKISPSAYYDDANKILTLDGAYLNYAGTDRNAVVSGIKELNVLLKNNSVISIQNNYDSNYPDDWRIFNYAFQYYAGTDGELTFVLDEANRSSLGQLTIENMEDPTSATDPQVAIGYAPFVAFGSIQQSVADLATTNTGSGWIKTIATTQNNGLTLSYSPDNYDLWIAGTRVNSFNAGNVFAGDATNDGKVIFTPDATTANSGTLKLNGFTKTNADAAIVSSLDNLTIEFSGANEIGANNGIDGFVKSSNPAATLTFKGGAANSTLDLHSSNNDAVVEGFNLVQYDGAYWSYSGPITYDTSSRKYLNQYGDLNLLTITTTPQYLLWITDIQVSADNYDQIMGPGETSVIYDDGTKTLTLDGCSISSMNGIVSALPSLNIKLKGNNSVGTYYSGYSPIVSSVSTATLNIQRADGVNNCSLELTTMGSDPVVKGFDSVSYPDFDLKVTAGTGTSLKDATVYGATLSVQAYPLWIGNTQVNAANAGNVLSGTANDGKVSYVHNATNNTGTLTLNDAQLVGDIATSMSDLTIHIKGGCQIIAKSNCIRSSATTPGTLTFTREDAAGDLTLNNMNAVDPNNPSNTKSMSAIKGFSTLAGLPLVTKEPYEIDAYYRLKKTLSSDTSTVDCAWVNADTTYPVWVNGKQVTSASKNNVLEAATATVSFDVDNNTLTLDGAAFTTNEGYGVVTGNNLTVKLAGSNSITCDNAADFAFKGYSTTGAAGAPTVTIGTDISNPGSLTLNLKTSGNLFSNISPVLDNDLTRFDDGSNGTYYVTRITPVTNYNLWVGSTRVTSANATDVLPTGLTAGKVKYTHDATNNTGTLTLDDVTLAEGIYTTMADLTINIKGSCQISPSATKNSNCIMSTANNGILTFTKESGGKLILNNGAQHYSVIRGFSSLAGLPLETTKPYELETTTMGYYRLKDKLASDTASVEVAYIGADTTYPLWVSGIQVTSSNNGNVFNDGTISFGSNTLTLNGATIPVSIVSDIPSLTISLLKDNTVSDGILSTDATTSLTIAKDATATGDVSLLAKTGTGSAIKGFSSISYTGLTPFSVDASDNPVTDITNSMTYTGNALKLSGSDLSAVYFGIPTNMESTSYSYSMGSKTYDGSAFALPATITMTETATNTNTTLTAGKDFDFTGGYKDSKKTTLTTGAPKDAGSYYATIQGKNGYSGTVDVPFTIDPITASLSWDTTQLTYNGTPQAPAVSVSNLLSGESCTVTVTGQQTNASATAYTATATGLSNSNYQLPKTNLTQTFTINSLTATLSWKNTSFTYDGAAHVPTATVTNLQGTDACTVTVTGQQTNASATAYTATATGLSNSNYQLPNTGLTQNFTISAKSMTDGSITVEVTGPPYTYDGDAKTPTITVKDGNNPLTINTDYSVCYQKKDDNGYYVNVNEVKEAGTYKAVVTGANNYQDEKSSNEFSVGKAAINVVTVSIAGWNYGDAANSPFVTAGNPGNATVKYEYKQENAGDDTYTETVPTNADTYIVRATVPSTANYQEANGTIKFTINPRVVTLDWTNLSFDYDGDEHKPTATVSNKVGSDVCTVTVTGGQTNAGNNYIATASGLSNNNYTLSTATTLTTNFTINPREVTLTWSNTEFTYDGQEHKPMATVTNLVKTDACNVTVTGGQTNAGNYTATASALDNTNYKLPTPNPTTTFTIKDRTANITFNAGQKYKTFYSAGENLLVPDNVKAYVVTSVTGNTVNITQISYIHANAPVLLESSSGATTVKDPNETLPTNLLKYASAGVNTNGKQYVLYSGEFVKATGTIPVGRVYLELPSSSARTLVISTDNTTAIDASFKDDADGEEKWYDMQGRQINKPTKAGLYIKNGQKVVIKNK